MPHETGVKINGDVVHPHIPRMGKVFGEAGYETAWAGGKAKYVRLDNDIESLPVAVQPCSTREHLQAAEYDEHVADAAIQFLRQEHDRPFLLGVAFQNPHDIGYWAMREPVEHPGADGFPPLPSNFGVPREPEFLQGYRERDFYGGEYLFTRDWDADQWRAHLHVYYRLIESADASLGRVLAALRESRLEEDTLVIFTADHGGCMGAHRWSSCLVLYEESVKVPLLVSWKGVTPEGAVDEGHLVSGVDVLPTMCDYAGISPLRDMAGTSLRQVIERPESEGREYVVSELFADPEDVTRQGRMLRTRQYKYSIFSEGRDQEMLFDLASDPGEMANLAGDPGMRTVLGEHRSLLEEWIAQTGDEFRLPGRGHHR